MAQELDDGEFWLPSEFLTDDDLLMDFKADYSKSRRFDEFSLGLGFNSDLSSPVEGSESEEDDFISGLTPEMARSTINDANLVKGLQLSGSPQSTLCGFKPGSNQSSPNSASRVSSPPESKEAVCWDLLYAAAGEIARMKNAPPRIPNASTAVTKPNPQSTYYPTQTQTDAHLAFLQLQASHYQRMNQQQVTKGGVWGQGKMEYHHQFHNGGKVTGEIGRTQGLSMAAWPTLQQSQQQQQQPAGSGMRAVFLGETGAKKERTGTGVFLPRRVGANPTEIRKKPVCSTVLLPDRVVHALNLNLDSVDVQPHLKHETIPNTAASNESRTQASTRVDLLTSATSNQDFGGGGRGSFSAVIYWNF